MPEAARIVLYALVAAASPLTIVATLILLGSGRGRANGVAFAVAFVAGQSLSFIVALFVGAAVSNRRHDTVSGAIELATGALLLVIAVRERPPHVLQPQTTPRTQALFERLARVTPGKAIGIGFPLGIGMKRLFITVLAAGTVTLAGLGPADKASLGLLYVAVASVTVWAPVAVYVLLGPRSDDLMAAARGWIASHELMLTFVLSLVVGILFALDGAIRLHA
jgi:hypothetical protein